MSNTFESYLFLHVIYFGVDLDVLSNYVSQDSNIINIALDDYDTPLSLACGYGRESVVNYLLDNGADPNLQSSEGFNPLLLSILKGVPTIVTRMIQAGATVDETHLENALIRWYHTPEILTAILNSIDLSNIIDKPLDKTSEPIVVTLLKNSKGDAKTIPILNMLLPFDPEWQLTDKNGNTILHLACAEQVPNLLLIEWMMTYCSASSMIHCQNSDEDTVIDLVKRHENHEQILTMLTG
jgi:Ankyrin repeats (many copies)